MPILEYVNGGAYYSKVLIKGDHGFKMLLFRLLQQFQPLLAMILAGKSARQ